jgi:hypothetical protein
LVQPNLKNKTAALPSTQEHVLARAVRDNVYVLRSGDLAAVIEVEGIDLTRLADDARVGLIAQYENFLLTLRFPYQIIVARKRQRLEEYLAYIQDQALQRGRDKQPEYARALHGWIKFMQEVVGKVNPQAPQYLIALPYDTLSPEERARGKLAVTAETYRRGLDELAHRCDAVVRGLTRIGLGARRLADQELVALLHRVYHPSIPDYRVLPTARLKSLFAQVIFDDQPATDGGAAYG